MFKTVSYWLVPCLLGALLMLAIACVTASLILPYQNPGTKREVVKVYTPSPAAIGKCSVTLTPKPFANFSASIFSATYKQTKALLS